MALLFGVKQSVVLLQINQEIYNCSLVVMQLLEIPHLIPLLLILQQELFKILVKGMLCYLRWMRMEMKFGLGHMVEMKEIKQLECNIIQITGLLYLHIPLHQYLGTLILVWIHYLLKQIAWVLLLAKLILHP